MTHKANESKSENGLPSITGDNVHVMMLVHNDQQRRIFEISLAATLCKIREATVIEAVDEVLNMLHNEQFCVDLFKAVVKCSREFPLIT